MSSAKQEVMTKAASSSDGREAVDAAIRRRFATRSFTSRPVPKQTITDILDVARFAPSGANIQPWRVYVVAGTKKEEISRTLSRAHEEARDQHASEYQYYASQLPEPYSSRRAQFGRLFYGSLGIEQSDMIGRARQTSKNYGFFGAPVGLIISIDRRLQVGSWLDLGMFIQNVMIAAGARGLQTCTRRKPSRNIMHCSERCFRFRQRKSWFAECRLDWPGRERERRKPDAESSHRRICRVCWFRGLRRSISKRLRRS